MPRIAIMGVAEIAPITAENAPNFYHRIHCNNVAMLKKRLHVRIWDTKTHPNSEFWIYVQFFKRETFCSLESERARGKFDLDHHFAFLTDFLIWLKR